MDWGALISTFGLVFVAELGDKTQLAVVTQTCKYRRPWAVFAGASLALTLVTALGAVAGRWLYGIVPAGVLRTVAALAFIVLGGLVAWEATKEAKGTGLTVTCDDSDQDVAGWDWEAFASTLGLLFLAELGDKTQLAVLGLTGRGGAPWWVFLGGALALTAVTALGVVGGEGLCRLIPQRMLMWISAGAFVLMGALMAFGVL